MTLAAALLLALLAPTGALAAPTVRLSARLLPERLGGGTTIAISLALGSSEQVPPPLREVDFRYPKNFGIALSGLGLETCTTAVLEALGPAGCPVDSVMGYGSAVGEIPFGPEIVRENAAVTVLRAADDNGKLALLFDAEGISPVSAHVVLPAVLEPASPPYGGDIAIEVPPVPSLPEAPDVSVAELSAKIGPAAGITYFERRHGSIVSYVPKGILLPSRCPRGGFPFSAAVTFIEGGRASADSRVRCPTRKPRKARHRRR